MGSRVLNYGFQWGLYNLNPKLVSVCMVHWEVIHGNHGPNEECSPEAAEEGKATDRV